MRLTSSPAGRFRPALRRGDPVVPARGGRVGVARGPAGRRVPGCGAARRIGRGRGSRGCRWSSHRRRRRRVGGRRFRSRARRGRVPGRRYRLRPRRRILARLRFRRRTGYGLSTRCPVGKPTRRGGRGLAHGLTAAVQLVAERGSRARQRVSRPAQVAGTIIVRRGQAGPVAQRVRGTGLSLIHLVGGKRRNSGHAVTAGIAGP